MGIFLSFIACKSVIYFSISQIYIVITFYCVRCAFRQKVFCSWFPSCNASNSWSMFISMPFLYKRELSC